MFYFSIYKYYKSFFKNKRKKIILNNRQKLINNLVNIKDKRINVKIKRIKEPKELNDLKILTNDFNNNPSKWINLIKVGEIYTKGSYPILLPNKYLGLECFKIAMKSPDKNIASLGYLKYTENKYNNINDIDQQGKRIPIEYANKICTIAKKNILQNYYNFLNTNNIDQIINNNDNIINNNDNYLVEIDLNNDQNNDQNNDKNNNINDLQNVHDHSVNNIIKSNIELLKKKYNILELNNEQLHDIFYNKIFEDNGLSEEQRYNIIHVLQNLTNIKHNYFDISELDSLKYIYEYIKNQQNPNELLHILFIELANCIENGFIICTTGKISHIVSIMDGLDNDFNSIKPIYIIKNEIQNLAHIIRKNTINNSSQIEVNTYINNINDILYEKMKNEFIKQVNELYCNKLNCNENIINPIIEECILGF